MSEIEKNKNIIKDDNSIENDMNILELDSTIIEHRPLAFLRESLDSTEVLSQL